MCEERTIDIPLTQDDIDTIISSIKCAMSEAHGDGTEDYTPFDFEDENNLIRKLEEYSDLI